MATAFKACAVDGCKGNAHYTESGALGFCRTHYVRQNRHGSPHIVKNPWGKCRSWVEDHSDYQGDDCLKWPFGQNGAGYGVINAVEGRMSASRFMCMVAHGQPDRKDLDAAHSCGKGHEGCVNPRHLRWDTRSGNFADKIGHGTDNRGERNPLAKLTADDIAEIRRLRGSLPQTAIAEMFGIDQSNVSLIQRGKSWAWLA